MKKMKLIALSGKKRVGKGTVTNMILEEVGKNLRARAAGNDFLERLYAHHESDVALAGLDVVEYQLAAPIKEALYDTLPEKVQYLTYEDFDGNGSVNRDNDVLPINRTDVKRWLKNAVQWLSLNKLPIECDLTDDINDVAKFNKKWTIRDMLTTLGTDLIVDRYDCVYWCRLFGTELATQLCDGRHVIIVSDVRQEMEMDLMRSLGAEIVHIQRDTGMTDNHSTNKGLPVLEGDKVILNNGTLDELREQVKQLRSLQDAK